MIADELLGDATKDEIIDELIRVLTSQLLAKKQKEPFLRLCGASLELSNETPWLIMPSEKEIYDLLVSGIDFINKEEMAQFQK